MTACGQPGQESIDLPDLVQPTVDKTLEKFPFEGIWFEQDRGSMLVITAETVYLQEFGAGREVYARIEEVDREAETTTTYITSIMFIGRSVGYDTPKVQIRYHVNGTAMYILDEFLNSGKK